MKIKNIIIGAGPAGIQMADLFRNEEYLILEKANVPCSFFHKFPRQRKLISVNKSKNLRYDWNSFLGEHLSFKDYSEEMYPHVDDYLRYVNDFIKLRNIKIQYNFEVKTLEKRDDLFYINDGEYIAERVFFGIGLVHKEPIIPISKESSHLKVFTYADMPCDKEVYRDKNIIIIGSGNAAFETIKWLEPFTNKIRVFAGTERKAWQTHYPGHLRSVNFQALDSYYLKTQMFITWSCNTQQILKHLYAPYEYSIAIFCHGFKFKSDIVKDLVDVDVFPVLTPNFESTKCKNLFFIGSNSQQHDYKKGTSAFIHGFRYNCQYLARHLKNEIIFKNIKTRDDLVHHIIRDMNTSSALFHRFDYFCILIGFPEHGYEYISEIPLSSVPYYINESWTKYITIKLGYNDLKLPNTFLQNAHAFPRNAHLGLFLHPIIETKDGKLFHLPEQAFMEFFIDNYHVKPLCLYLDVIEGKKTIEEVSKLIKTIDDTGVPRFDLLK